MLRLWRQAHLIVGLISILYLTIASLTGGILGINQGMNPGANHSEQSLASTLQKLYIKYPELVSLKKTDQGELDIQAFDEEMNEVRGILNPETAEIKPKIKEHPVIRWSREIHRSLLLESTGRAIVGIFAGLFVLELIFGLFLLIKIFPTTRSLFTEWSFESLSKTLHLMGGRIVLIPLFISGLSAVYLSMERFDLLPKEQPVKELILTNSVSSPRPYTRFTEFENTALKDFISLDFPFDKSEPFLLETKNNKIELDAISGKILKKENKKSYWANQAYALHTGTAGILWSWGIAICVLTIPFFIISGLIIWRKRVGNRSVHTYATAQETEVAILYGSENGSTRQHAESYARQLQEAGMKVWLSSLNEFQEFPNARDILILSATYGQGDAPSDADQALDFLAQTLLEPSTRISLLGLGSKDYTHFCGFANDLAAGIRENFPENPLLYHQVSNRDQDEIAQFETAFAQFSGLRIQYQSRNEVMENADWKVLSVSSVSEKNKYLHIHLEDPTTQAESGDLLRVQVPGGFRYYSISRTDTGIELLVKYHTGGLASEIFKNAIPGSNIRAALETNPDFKLKTNHATLLVSNGVGLAPFLGMLRNRNESKVQIYAGFRYLEPQVESWIRELEALNPDKLFLSFSGDSERPERITNQIQRNKSDIQQHFHTGGHMMLCGSIGLKHEIEKILSGFGLNVEKLYSNGQLHSDCY